MKHEYKIDTGLWYYQCETSKDREKFMFDSDEEAWNKLRLVIPNKSVDAIICDLPYG